LWAYTTYLLNESDKLRDVEYSKVLKYCESISVPIEREYMKISINDPGVQEIIDMYSNGILYEPIA
jgi:hypothetical protein